MSLEIIISDQRPEIQFTDGFCAYMDQEAMFVVNFPIIKGDKGDPGSDANVLAHTNMFDHGDLHEHANKGLLDLMSVIEQDLAYNGRTAVSSVLESPEVYNYVVGLINSLVSASMAAHVAAYHAGP